MRSIAKDLLPPAIVRWGRRLTGDSPLAGAGDVQASFSSPCVDSYSQYGEDLVLDAVLGCQETGFFLDIGANDPVVFSNTKRFALRGWTGISVEPNPTVFDRITKDRPHDINLNLGVGSTDSMLTFYRIEPDTLSTFDKAHAERSIKVFAGARIVDTVEVQVVSLSTLLGEHLAEDTRVDFMSMDVEGGELEALKSNDWDRYRPSLLMIEVAFSGEEIVGFLESVDYVEVWCNGCNALFMDHRG
jgi:FkbM family methyltransferase